MSTAHLDELADRVVSPERTAVWAFEGDRLIGVAHFYRAPGQAHPEVAVAVAHEHQHRGCGISCSAAAAPASPPGSGSATTSTR